MMTTMDRRDFLRAASILAVTGMAAGRGSPLVVAGLGDCEKITKDGLVPPSPRYWDPARRRLSLHGGRNEVVAAQLILTATAGDVENVDVEIGDLRGPGVIAADPNIALYLQAYQYVEHGNWEGFSTVLPDHKWYPDVLVPFRDPYSTAHRAVGAPFPIRTANGPNQGVWIDVYIPRTATPGTYEAPVLVKVGGKVNSRASLVLKVHGFTLSDEFHVDGFGQLFGHAYRYHNASYAKAGVDRWWEVAKRYHQMAHQHRFVATDTWGQGPNASNWSDYDKTYGTELDGSLFTAREGYVGPGENTGLPFWEAPIRHGFNGFVPIFTEEQLRQYTQEAREYWEHVSLRGWQKRRFFAYIIDEAGADARDVENLRKLQAALDAGAGPGKINLIWTSHTNPALLAKDPQTDLRGIIRWWAPNGEGCDPRFLSDRVKLGETVWFYHHGHPCNGVHAVNASGVELRTWGTICWRYMLSGSFWWGLDYSDEHNPMTKPIYRPRETRWGNGVMFYSGARLPDIGFPAIDGPLSSLRMKAYRRGLQDYEYCWLLAQKGKRDIADNAMRKLIPMALTEALDADNPVSGKASVAADRLTGDWPEDRVYLPPWKTDVDAWYGVHEELASALDA
jgi:hypothetical protein